VQFRPATHEPAATAGTYVVVRQLPEELQEYQYRVRSAADGRERMVRESQLSTGANAVVAPWAAGAATSRG
jgi:SH3-like domain-containing protein